QQAAEGETLETLTALHKMIASRTTGANTEELSNCLVVELALAYRINKLGHLLSELGVEVELVRHRRVVQERELNYSLLQVGRELDAELSNSAEGDMTIIEVGNL